MNPDELRAAAVKLTSPWVEDDDAVYASTDDREWWSSLRKGRDAARRLADVLDLAADVAEHWRGLNDTHSESCWKWHAACLARVLRDMEDQ